MQANITSSFKSVSREIKPSWANRFVKDSYDLVYPTKSTLMLSPHRQTKMREQTPPMHAVAQLPSRKSRKSPVSPVHKSSSLKLIVQTIRDGLNNPQDREQIQRAQGGRQIMEDKVEKVNLSTQRSPNISLTASPKKGGAGQSLNFFNLSQFQFAKTIGGRVAFRKDNHISLSKCKTNKIKNVNKIWNQVNFHDNHLLQSSSASKARIHSFRSYSSHKLFTGRPEEAEAKFYTVSAANFNLIRKQSSRGSVLYDKMHPRQGLPRKQGTHLEYNHTRPLGSESLKKKPLMELSLVPRIIRFEREVINNTKVFR